MFDGLGGCPFHLDLRQTLVKRVHDWNHARYHGEVGTGYTTYPKTFSDHREDLQVFNHCFSVFLLLVFKVQTYPQDRNNLLDYLKIA